MAISTNVTLTPWKGHASATLTSASHTIANNGGTRVLIVGISWYRSGAATTVSTVKWNTTESFTRLGGGGSGTSDHVDIWYLTNPTATSSTIVITFATTPSAAIAGGICYDGVDSTTQVQNFAVSANSNSRTPAIAITGSSTSNLILNVLAWDRFTATLSSPVAPASIIYNDNDNTDEGGAGASQASVGSGTLTIDWTNKLNVAANWLASGCEVKAAAGGGGGSTVVFRKTLSSLGTKTGSRQAIQ